MIEMIAVLVIMVFLVIGGLHLWNDAVNKSKAQSIMRSIISSRTEHKLTIGAHPNDQNTILTDAPYGSRLTTQNGTTGSENDYFWISVSQIDKNLCEKLFKLNTESLEDVLDKRANNCTSDTPNLTYFFTKFGGSNSTYSTGGNGDSGEGGNESNGNLNCQANEYPNGDHCESCGDHVVSCDADGTITECESDYYINGNQCQSCPNSTSCRINSDTVYSTGCKKKAVNCPGSVCKTDGSCGSSCLSGEYNSNGYCCSVGKKASGKICISCTNGEACGCTGREKWNGSGCSTDCSTSYPNSSTTVREGQQIGTTGCYCKTGYEVDGNTCKAVVCTSTVTTSIENCQTQTTCTNPSGTFYTCTECETGYELSETGDECVAACSTNSSTTVREGQQIGSTGCYCNEGFTLNSDQTACIEDSVCGGNMCCQAMLDAGYTLSDGTIDGTFSFNGNDINFVTNRQETRMEVKQNLDISSCNLKIDSSNTKSQVTSLVVNSGKELNVGSLYILNNTFTAAENNGTIAANKIEITGEGGAFINYGEITANEIIHTIAGAFTNYGTVVANSLESAGFILNEEDAVMHISVIQNMDDVVRFENEGEIEADTIISKMPESSTTKETGECPNAGFNNKGVARVTNKMDLRGYYGLCNYGDLYCPNIISDVSETKDSKGEIEIRPVGVFNYGYIETGALISKHGDYRSRGNSMRTSDKCSIQAATSIEIEDGGIVVASPCSVNAENLKAYGANYGLHGINSDTCTTSGSYSGVLDVHNAYFEGSMAALCKDLKTIKIENLHYCGNLPGNSFVEWDVKNEVNDCSWVPSHNL